MSNYTPGPWALREGAHFSVSDDSGRLVADIPIGPEWAERRNRANADLIARAPDLLAERDALRTQLELCQGIAEDRKTTIGDLCNRVDSLVESRNDIQAERDALRAKHLELLERNGLLGRDLYTATHERDALRAVLREILDGSGCVINGDQFACVIHREVKERAEKLIAPSELFAACTCDGETECEKCKAMRSAK